MSHPETQDLDLLHDIKELQKWGRELKIIRRIWIFGSRITGKSHSESDLDVAVEHDKMPGDQNRLATWVCDADKWRRRLNPQLRLKLDLWSYEGPSGTPTIHAGLQAGSLLIYERKPKGGSDG